MHLVLLAGADAAPFTREVAALLTSQERLTVVAPTARDRWGLALKQSPDLDAHLLGSPGPGGPSSGTAVAHALAALEFGAPWLRPDDATLAQQLVRTDLLQAGFSLTQATEAAATRLGLPFRLLPASDDRNELRVVVDDADGGRALHVDEALALGVPAAASTVVASGWDVTPEVVEALTAADVVAVAPTSRRLALEPMLAVPGLREALAGRAVLLADASAVTEPDLPPLTGEPLAGTAVPAGPQDLLDAARQDRR